MSTTTPTRTAPAGYATPRYDGPMSARTNRRATTDGRNVRDNSTFQARTLVDGWAVRSSGAIYYRRQTVAGRVLNGLAAEARS